MPIFKKGEKTKANNYRPVSLINLICKILEALLRDKIMQHMCKNELLSPLQHGFIGGRSCTTQLIRALDDWTNILEDGGNVDSIYLDFKKAFDSVPHEHLLRKLEGYGITDKVLNWIRAFLKERRQQVIVNGVKSGWSNVLSGIPQGSVLGPVLFVVYIHDMPDGIVNFIQMFADDTKIYASVKNTEDSRSLQNDINKLEEWAKI